MTRIINSIEKSEVELTKKDFKSNLPVKWCPGCGGYAVLSAVENVFPKIGYRKENFVLVSGIGCSSRFPYYVNTYGFHGIHGRATAIATGIKLANPRLSVWVITGDGDALAIGGNHFIHIIRKNVDVNILLFNNRIYGLTKGQFSPTSPTGLITKTSPYGVLEHPFNVGELVLGAQGTFFARVPDNDVKLMTEVLFEAAKHDGTSVVEILTNCVIYNNNIHAPITSKENRDENSVTLRPGQPIIFGKNKDKGIMLKGTELEVVKIGENGIKEEDLLIHDPYQKDPGIHMMLAKMWYPKFPVAFGVIRSALYPTYDDLVEFNIMMDKANSKIKNLEELMLTNEVFEIGDE